MAYICTYKASTVNVFYFRLYIVRLFLVQNEKISSNASHKITFGLVEIKLSRKSFEVFFSGN